MSLNIKKTMLTTLLAIILIAVLGTILFNLWSKPDLTKDASSQIINSSYPTDTPVAFSLPPLGPDPFAQLNATAVDLNGYIADQRTNAPGYSGSVIFGMRATPEMHSKFADGSLPSFWLADNQPFSGVLLVEPDFAAGKDEGHYAVKAALDGKELELATSSNNFTNTVLLHIKRGERALLSFRTTAIPEGKHNLNFMLFGDIYNNDPGFQARLSSADTNITSYEVYVGTTIPARKVAFRDWSVTSNLPGNDNSFIVNEGRIDADGGIPLWTPSPFEAAKKVEYTAIINNSSSYDREYCLSALLDYQQIETQNNNVVVCGIVRANHLGKFKSSFLTPTQPGIHTFQMIRFENPLNKTSYNNTSPRTTFSVRSSARTLIQVK